MEHEATMQQNRRPENGNVVRLKRRKKEKEKKIYSADFCVLALVIGLVIFGIMMVFSASYYTAIGEYGTPFYYLKRTFFYAVLGTAVMVFFAMTDYHLLARFAVPILAVSFLMLLAILVTPLGVTLNNATRWLRIGGLTIMPGELAKPACIIFVSTWLSRKPNRILDLKEGVAPVLLVMVAFCMLIFLQPNLSTMLTLVFIILGIMFIAGMRRLHLLVIGLTGGVALIFYLLHDTSNYQSGRLMNFWDPFSDPGGSGYQVSQGLLAMGSGGVFGSGLGQSMQKTLYLPEPQNDFILAIVGEELGFIGILLLLAAYILLIWRCVRIAIKAPDMLGTLIASGFTIMLAVQVIMNVMIVTAMMPPTGVILPFVSWGGNALIMFIGCMGIMMNISRYRKN